MAEIQDLSLDDCGPWRCAHRVVGAKIAEETFRYFPLIAHQTSLLWTTSESVDDCWSYEPHIQVHESYSQHNNLELGTPSSYIYCFYILRVS